MTRRGFRRAFSLVEMVIVLGIISFSLIAILALCSVGLKSVRRSADDTNVANMAWQVDNELNSTNYPASDTSTNFYFDSSGQATNSSSAYYVCSVSSRVPAATEIPDVTTNLVLLQLSFTWPAQLPAAQRPQTNIVEATLQGEQP